MHVSTQIHVYDMREVQVLDRRFTVRFSLRFVGRCMGFIYLLHVYYYEVVHKVYELTIKP